ncbi:hypothetical protein LZ31DRAFT_481124 [Colletotrichum somersetense]|nr:hypothetical protein LZ31DRAFT_481124 [Colletotrichum somersetense]
MRYSLVFFLLPAIISAQRVKPPPKPPVSPQTGGQCCLSSGVADPTETCSKMGLNSFCCDNTPNFLNNGCDGNVNGFFVGRKIQGFPATNNSCTAGNGAVGFIGCA